MLDTTARYAHPADDFIVPPSPDDFIVQRSPHDESSTIRLRDMMPLLESGAERKTIAEKFPDLDPRKIHKVRGFYNARVLPRPARGQGGPATETDLHVLCDENISPLQVCDCQSLFNYASSVGFEGLNGRPDQDVWAHAVASGFDIIVTQDVRNRTLTDKKTKAHLPPVDLTRIALDHWRAWLADLQRDSDAVAASPRPPMLVHLKGGARVPEQFSTRMSGTLRDIFHHYRGAQTPVVVLADRGLNVLTSAEELLAPPVVSGPVSRSRCEADARSYLPLLLPDAKKWKDRETPEILERKKKLTRIIATVDRSRRAPETPKTPEERRAALQSASSRRQSARGKKQGVPALP